VRAQSVGARPVIARDGARWLVGLGSWVAFGAAWWFVAHRHAQVDAQVLIGLGGTAAGVLLVTVLWVWRNRQIYRVKGPRRQVPAADHPHVVDRLGRQLRIVPASYVAAQVVVRVTEDGCKTYEPVEGPR